MASVREERECRPREKERQTHGKTRHAPEELACCASDCRRSSADLTMSADPSWERAIVRAMVVKRRERGRRSGQLSREDGAEQSLDGAGSRVT